MFSMATHLVSYSLSVLCGCYETHYINCNMLLNFILDARACNVHTSLKKVLNLGLKEPRKDNAALIRREYI